MQLCQVGQIKYYKFQSFEGLGLNQAVFTRHGGVSPSPWESLNLGASVGDDICRVTQNRRNALTTLNISVDSVYDVYQVHSTKVVVTDRPLYPDEIHLRADAILTNMPGVTLMMRFADCVPIFLFDRVNRVIGLAHAGWIGTVNKIIKKAIEVMNQHFKCKPGNILAAIGPSIGPDHYSVGDDVVRRVTACFGNEADKLINNTSGKVCFNLWEANRVTLLEAGVTKIEVAEICTNCHLEDWYSHRGEHGKTGRFGAILAISG
jgi:YfiH family protein